MSYHTTGVLFKDSFGTAEMREIVSEESFVRRFLEVEAALARAEATAGLVPEWAAEEITRKATLEHVDLAEIEANVEEIGLFTMAIIEAWKDSFDEAGEYVHWGATSQDISDTAMVLVLRDAFDVLVEELEAIRSILLELAEAYADTPMIGRTHHVHAIPITFGLKAATWLDEVDRQVTRLEELEDRLFTLQFFGATGTLASLEEGGEEVQANLAAELDLEVPNVGWYAARDRFAEFASALGMAATTLGKVANQVVVSNRPEIGELREPIPEGVIGSSTMPHKQNPVRSQVTVGLARLVRSHASTMVALMSGLDERDFSTWIVEFAILPEICLYTARIFRHSRDVLADLEVDTEAMDRNMRQFGALVTSEAIMMRLAEDLGRQTAHDVVHENAIAAIDADDDFRDRLLADERVAEHLSADDLERLTDPAGYTGYATTFVERTVDDVGTDEETETIDDVGPVDGAGTDDGSGTDDGAGTDDENETTDDA